MHRFCLLSVLRSGLWGLHTRHAARLRCRTSEMFAEMPAIRHRGAGHVDARTLSSRAYLRIHLLRSVSKRTPFVAWHGLLSPILRFARPGLLGLRPDRSYRRMVSGVRIAKEAYNLFALETVVDSVARAGGSRCRRVHRVAAARNFRQRQTTVLR